MASTSVGTSDEGVGGRPYHALDQSSGHGLCRLLHVVRQLDRSRTIELAGDADRGQRARDWPAGIGHRHGHDSYAGDVVAAVDAETLAPDGFDFLAPGLPARRLVPAQRAEALLDLGPGMIGEGRHAAAGGADQGREAAADIDMDAHR